MDFVVHGLALIALHDPAGKVDGHAFALKYNEWPFISSDLKSLTTQALTWTMMGNDSSGYIRRKILALS